MVFSLLPLWNIAVPCYRFPSLFLLIPTPTVTTGTFIAIAHFRESRGRWFFHSRLHSFVASESLSGHAVKFLPLQSRLKENGCHCRSSSIRRFRTVGQAAGNAM